MGEPAIPTDDERALYREYAQRVMDAVRNEEDHPTPLYPDGDVMPDETMMFHLAQEVELQAEEIKQLQKQLLERRLGVRPR